MLSLSAFFNLVTWSLAGLEHEQKFVLSLREVYNALRAEQTISQKRMVGLQELVHSQEQDCTCKEAGERLMTPCHRQHLNL